MNQTDYQSCITAGQAILGIELGSTRIKAVLIAPDHTPLAHGDFEWENLLENGIWTYHLEDVWTGLQNCWKKISLDVQEKYHVPLQKLGAMGISGMMHGYLVFDRDQNQLAPFRTWRNTMTEQAARELTERFGFNIPQRWSIAHLYQAILNGEEHVSKIARMTTLAGYVHWKLTGENMLGVSLPCRYSGGRHPPIAGRCQHPRQSGLALHMEGLHPAGSCGAVGVLLPSFL